MITPPCLKLRSPRNPHEHPHEHRGKLSLPLFGRMLVLFWMLAMQCLRADICDVRVGILAQGRPDALAWTDRIVAGLSIHGFVFLNRTDGAPPWKPGSITWCS